MNKALYIGVPSSDNPPNLAIFSLQKSCISESGCSISPKEAIRVSISTNRPNDIELSYKASCSNSINFLVIGLPAPGDR